MKHKKAMKKKVCMLVCGLLLAVGLFPLPAMADTGPKPSINITFEGMEEGRLCYGTLLSKTESNGPNSVWNGKEEDAAHNENEQYDWKAFDRSTWKAFVEYEDPDGYYFLQEGWRVDKTKALNWTYYPPSPFKILLYYPDSNTFITSGVYEKYAFDSYFTVSVEDLILPTAAEKTPVTLEEELVATKSYDHTWELISLAVRVVMTILLELGIALLFGFRGKRALMTLLWVNVVTQVLLNVLLNIINYNRGSLAFVAFYFVLEILVTDIEAVIYSRRLEHPNKKRWPAVVYAVVANVASWGIGYGLALWIPGIF